MDTWVKISSLLCIFGFLKEFRPSEPYITPYLTGPPMNFSNEQVSQEIYPVATYSNMLSLIIVLLVTDLLRYKIVIIADAITGVCVYIGLILFNTVFAIQEERAITFNAASLADEKSSFQNSQDESTQLTSAVRQTTYPLCNNGLHFDESLPLGQSALVLVSCRNRNESLPTFFVIVKFYHFNQPMSYFEADEITKIISCMRYFTVSIFMDLFRLILAPVFWNNICDSKSYSFYSKAGG